MKKIIIAFSSFILFIIVLYCILLFGFKVYFTPFDAYYIDSGTSKELISGNVGLEYLMVSREYRLFTIDTDQRLYLYVDDNIKNRDMKLLSIKIESDNKEVLFYKNYNKNVNDLGNKVEEIHYRDNNVSTNGTNGKTYVLLKKSLKPSKYKYIDLEFVFLIDNKKKSYKERLDVKKYPAGLRIPGS